MVFLTLETTHTTEPILVYKHDDPKKHHFAYMKALGVTYQALSMKIPIVYKISSVKGEGEGEREGEGYKNGIALMRHKKKINTPFPQRTHH